MSSYTLVFPYDEVVLRFVVPKLDVNVFDVSTVGRGQCFVVCEEMSLLIVELEVSRYECARFPPSFFRYVAVGWQWQPTIRRRVCWQRALAILGES